MSVTIATDTSGYMWEHWQLRANRNFPPALKVVTHTVHASACPYIHIETCQVLCFLYGSIIWPDYGLLLELRTPTQATHSWGCVYTGWLHNCLILLSYHLKLYRLLLVTQCFNNIRELLTTWETIKQRSPNLLVEYRILQDIDNHGEWYEYYFGSSSVFSSGIPVSNLSPSTMYEFQVTLTDSQKQEKYFSATTSGCTLPGKLLLFSTAGGTRGLLGTMCPTNDCVWRGIYYSYNILTRTHQFR